MYIEPKSFYLDIKDNDSIKHYRFDTYFNWEIYNIVKTYSFLYNC